MAQKTPLPALTIDYADRWNSNMFCELKEIRYKLMEDYCLRTLITFYLRLKRYWLHLLNINCATSSIFISCIFLNSRHRKKYNSFYKPDILISKFKKLFLNKLKKELSSNTLLPYKYLNTIVLKKYKFSLKKKKYWKKYEILFSRNLFFKQHSFFFKTKILFNFLPLAFFLRY